MPSLPVFLLLLAALCFFIAACGVASKVNLVAAGLFLWVLSLLLGR